MTANLTHLEITILTTCRNNEFGDPAEVPVWTWSLIANSGITPKTARGVLASLSKKGLAVNDDNGTNNPDDASFYLTEEGVKVSNELIEAINKAKTNAG